MAAIDDVCYRGCGCNAIEDALVDGSAIKDVCYRGCKLYMTTAAIDG